MSNKLQWAFELIDKMSGPSSKIEKALVTVKKRLDDGSVATVRFQQNLGKTKADAGGFANVLESVGLSAGGLQTAVLGIGAALVTASAAFGAFAMHELAFKESTLASFKLMLGTRQAAKDLFGESLQLAKQTPFGEGDVVGSYKELMSAGFSQKEVPIVFQALGDVAAASGFKKEAMGMITTQLSQVKGVGKLQMMDLKQIIGWTAPAGVGLNKVYEQIAKIRGISKEAVPALLSGGQVKADEGIFAIISAIKEASGGKVGNVMVEQSKTLTGEMTRLKAAAANAFLALDLDNLPGFEAVKNFLHMINGLFAAGTPTAERFEHVIKGLVNDLGVGLFGDFTPDDMTTGFNRILDAVEGTRIVLRGLIDAGKAFWAGFSPALEAVWPLLQKGNEQGDGFITMMRFLGVAVGTTAGMILRLAALPTTLREKFESFSEWWRNLWKTMGLNIFEGITAGLVGSPLSKLLVDKLRSMVGAGNDELEIHSPSRVFERMGRYTMMGFEEGVDGGAADARASVQSAVQPTPVRRNIGTSPNVTLSLPMHVVATDGDGAEAVARQLREILPEELMAMVNRAVTESGS